MKIEKVQWERSEIDSMCDDCNRRATWVLNYDILEYSFWRHACSDHKETGQFLCYAGKECLIIEAV
jgi:hypothetical protein